MVGPTSYQAAVDQNVSRRVASRVEDRSADARQGRDEGSARGAREEIKLSTTNPSWLVADEELDTWNDDAAAATITASHPSFKFYNDTITVYFDATPHIYYRKNEAGERKEIDGVTTVLDVIHKPYLVPWAAKLTVETLKKFLLSPDGGINEFSTEELLGWFEEAKRAHKDKLNTAGTIGTLAHNAIEDSIKHAIAHTGGVVKTCPVVKVAPNTPVSEMPTSEEIEQAQNCASAAFNWMVAHNVRWLHTERKIYSREYNYSGTLDGDALIDSCTDRFCRGCMGRVFKDRRAITDWKTSNQLSDSYAYQTAAYQFAHIEEFPDLYIPDRWIMRLGKTDGDFECWYLPDEHFVADFEAFLAALNLYRSLEEIEQRRKAERKKFTEFVRTEKKGAKEAAETAEKVRKAEEREKLKAAKVLFDEDRKLLYKELRLKKMSKADAEAQVERMFPKSSRPGAKEEIEAVVPEPSAKELAGQFASQMITNLRRNVVAQQAAVQAVTQSSRRIIKLDDKPATTQCRPRRVIKL